MSAHQTGDDEEDTEPSAASTSRNVRPSGMSVAELLSAPSESSFGTSTNSNIARRSSGEATIQAEASSSRVTVKQAEEFPSGQSMAKAPPRDSLSMSPPSAPQTSTMETTTLTSGEGVAAYQYTPMKQITHQRENIEYKLRIREQPKHSRMCGIGEKADRRPIDPAPIIQLRVIIHDQPAPPDWNAKGKQKESKDEDDIKVMPAKSVNNLGSTDGRGAVASTTVSSSNGKKILRRGVPVESSWGAGWEDKTWYLENPYYFMYAVLAHAELDEELHLLQDGKTRYTTGSCVSCLYHLKDIDGSQQGFFVFPDLSIRVEGRYRLKLCLFETIGHEVHYCASIYTNAFNVYTAKRFPGMDESTMLSRSFADQGLKVRVRKNPRIRRGRISGSGSGSKRKDMFDSDDDSDGRAYSMEMTTSNTATESRSYPSVVKRARNEELNPQEQYAHGYDLKMPLQPQRPTPSVSGAIVSPPNQPYYPSRELSGEPQRDSPFSRPPINVQTPASELILRQAQNRHMQQVQQPQQRHQEDHKAQAVHYPRHAMPPPVAETHYQARPEIYRPIIDRDSRRSSPTRSLASISRFEDHQGPSQVPSRAEYEHGGPSQYSRAPHFSTPSSALHEYSASSRNHLRPDVYRDRDRSAQSYPDESNRAGETRMALPPLNVAFSSEYHQQEQQGTSRQYLDHPSSFFSASRLQGTPYTTTAPVSSLMQPQQQSLPNQFPSTRTGPPRLPSIPHRRDDHRNNNT